SVRLYLNDKFLVELIASPGHLKELGVGFVICEGLAQEIEAVCQTNEEIRVWAPADKIQHWILESGGGLRARRPPRKVAAPLTIEPAVVHRVMHEIECDVWKMTGAVHCAVLFQEGNLVIRSSDIGRHNTVDKVVGFAILNGIDLSKCIIGCSGRQPAGMVSKVANAGIPIIISKAASTDKGILTAKEAGITLICFARGDRFTIYTHPQRIAGVTEQITL
ncbi:MAG: formate dehydrogenase accessory sulfurtransferase FdhD, partial [Chloroflexi bacterium]|nr:formate dehydrogenase accessory sulfurtransferase FdhD [Chloroflexota bacterium]